MDLVNDREIRLDEVKEWCEKNGNIPYFEVSAKTGQNINEAFMFSVEKTIINMKRKIIQSQFYNNYSYFNNISNTFENATCKEILGTKSEQVNFIPKRLIVIEMK